jgi:putative transposase
MPLRHRSLFVEHHLYFVTTSTHNHKPFPYQPESLASIQNTLFRTCIDKRIGLCAFVVMPTHLHLIANSETGSPGISRFMHSLKGRIREDFQGKGKFWQDRFDDVGIYSRKQFKIKLNYIHYNPVRAGLVDDPVLWPYSSYSDWMNGDKSRGILFPSDSLY